MKLFIRNPVSLVLMWFLASCVFLSLEPLKILTSGMPDSVESAWLIFFLTCASPIPILSIIQLFTVLVIEKRAKKALWPFISLLIFTWLSYGMTLNFYRARGDGIHLACDSNLKNLGEAVMLYEEASGGELPRKLEMLAPKYIRELPRCPSVKKPSYGYIFDRSIGTYTIFCSGENHWEVGLVGGYPQFSSVKGLIHKESEK